MKGDGEGCARLVGKDQLVAGEVTEFVIEFVVGPSGIRTGGGISLGIHHAAEWVTSTHKDYPGFVQIRSEVPGTLELARYQQAPPGMFTDTREGLNSDQMFHRLLVATVVDSPLAAGERVQFHFGGGRQGIKVIPYIDPDHQFRLTTDVDGDGAFKAIAQSPVFPVRAAPAAALTAVLPSQIVRGVPTALQLRAEDANHNLAADYSGSVSVWDERGTRVLNKLMLDAGIGEATIMLDTPGPHRLRLASTDGELTGRSNPLRVFETEPARKIYWADLHGHTGVSDGLGANAHEYFRFGRDVSRLDINALTDHGHFDWPANIKAVQDFHQPGQYVTLLAQEAGVRADHMNIYYRHDDTPHLARWRTNFGEQLEEIQSQFNSEEPTAMTAPHHFSYDRGDRSDPRYPFGYWDARVMRFVEVYSSHGTSEYPGNPRPLHRASSDAKKYMQDALAEGLKFGVIAASDNHDSHPGRSVWNRYPGGLAGVWAAELTREAVWQALHDYSTYGTSLDRIYLDFSINGQAMGSTLSAVNSIEIAADIIGKTDKLSATLIRDNAAIARFETDNGVIDLRYSDNDINSAHFYYVRVSQENGERAWSSPIWVEASERNRD